MVQKKNDPTLSHIQNDPKWGVEVVPEVPSVPFFKILGDSVNANRDRTALVSMGKGISYGGLWEISGKFANALLELGVKKGNRVGVLLPNCAQHVAVFLGIIRVGAISVPLNVLLKQEELTYIFNDAGIETVIAVDLLCPLIEMLKADTSVKDIISVHPKDISKPDSWVPPILSGEKQKMKDIPDFSELVERQKSDVPEISIDPKEDLALIIYTAGTTGFPKGVMETHYNMVYSLFVHVHLFGMRSDDINIQILPMFHIGGYFLCLFSLLSRGGKVVLVPAFDAGEFLKMIEKYSVNTIVAPPTLYVGLLNYPDFGKYDFSNFRFVIAAGAPVPIPLQKRWKDATGTDLSKGWGMTETNAGAIVNLPDKRNLDSIGVPLSGEVKIVDEAGSTLPRSETGEIWFKSDQVAKGYWQKPDETEKTFTDGWLHTGDAGYMDEDGFIHFVDRIKDLIIASGYNIAPTEVESAIMKHDAVSEVGVVGVTDDYRGETVKAFVVLREGLKEKITVDEIIAFSREHMAKYKAPTQVKFVDELPKNQIGKVLRYKLREM